MKLEINPPVPIGAFSVAFYRTISSQEPINWGSSEPALTVTVNDRGLVAEVDVCAGHMGPPGAYRAVMWPTGQEIFFDLPDDGYAEYIAKCNAMIDAII